MRKFKALVLFLLLCLATSMAPTHALALSPTAQTSDTGKSAINMLLGLLLGDLFTKVFHIDLSKIGNNMPAGTGDNGNVIIKPTSAKDVVGFYAEWYGDDTASFDDLGKHTDVISTIAPLWAGVHRDGSVTNRGGNDHPSVVKFAHGHKISTLLLVNNADSGIHNVLSNADTRQTAINNLEAYIKKYNLDGINVDFESVDPNDRDNLTQFMKELSLRLKPQGYVVSIDVFPKHNEENDMANAYDYAALSQYADKIMLMTYDYHGGWSDPGAVAGISSVEQDLRYALDLIPKNKLYLGIAGYGYDWSSKGTESMEFGAISNLVNKFGSTVEWDDAAKAPHFSYTGSDGVTHQVWFENSQSIKYKVNLVNKYDIAGIALWKLSEEDPADWDVIKTAFK